MNKCIFQFLFAFAIHFWFISRAQCEQFILGWGFWYIHRMVESTWGKAASVLPPAPDSVLCVEVGGGGWGEVIEAGVDVVQPAVDVQQLLWGDIVVGRRRQEAQVPSAHSRRPRHCWVTRVHVCSKIDIINRISQCMFCIRSSAILVLKYQIANYMTRNIER